MVMQCVSTKKWFCNGRGSGAGSLVIGIFLMRRVEIGAVGVMVVVVVEVVVVAVVISVVVLVVVDMRW